MRVHLLRRLLNIDGQLVFQRHQQTEQQQRQYNGHRVRVLEEAHRAREPSAKLQMS